MFKRNVSDDVFCQKRCVSCLFCIHEVGFNLQLCRSHFMMMVFDFYAQPDKLVYNIVSQDKEFVKGSSPMIATFFTDQVFSGFCGIPKPLATINSKHDAVGC